MISGTQREERELKEALKKLIELYRLWLHKHVSRFNFLIQFSCATLKHAATGK